jgi:hypothetical protein
VRSAWLFFVILFLVPCLETQGQSVPASTDAKSSVSLDLPLSQRGYKPKISLQAALKIAEDYVAAQHINVSDSWLSEARLFLYGDNDKAEKRNPCWLFVWITNSGRMGVHLDVIVSMDGKAIVSPSL